VLVGENFSKYCDGFIFEDEKQLLKEAFSNVMKASESEFSLLIKSLVLRLEKFQDSEAENQNKDSFCRHLDVYSLISRLYLDFGSDIGLFAVFFLNAFRLEYCFKLFFFRLVPGEALVLFANEPHAYLSGDGIECMACSDNVVRAGLTPKYRDVQTLCDMLTYQSRTNLGILFDRTLYTPKILDLEVNLYQPPLSIEEFALFRIEFSTSSSHQFSIDKGFESHGILFVYEGEVSIISSSTENAVQHGSIYFIPSGTHLKIRQRKHSILFICVENSSKLGSIYQIEKY
jgi:mannose-6-phosphate isomerase